MKRLFGIAGGMGPEASLKLCEYLLTGKNVSCDQDHEPYILFNNSEIPDRTAHILGLGPSPLKALTHTVQTLEKASCEFILIPCNTAHFYLDELRSLTKVPIINMIEETVNEILNLSLKPKSLGLLGSSGTLKSKLYQKPLKEKSFQILTPKKSLQEESVMKAIYALKGGEKISKARELLDPAICELKDKGADILIAACTELSCLFEEGVSSSLPVVDPLRVLAQKALALSRSHSLSNLL